MAGQIAKRGPVVYATSTGNDELRAFQGRHHRVFRLDPPVVGQPCRSDRRSDGASLRFVTCRPLAADEICRQ